MKRPALIAILVGLTLFGCLASSRFNGHTPTVVRANQSGPSSRPVVLVHGFNSNYQTWTTYLGTDGFLADDGLQGFAVGDGQVPGVMQTGSITDPGLKTNTIAQNAGELKKYIDGVKKLTGAKEVDLVVHSMGGLISRYYIDRLMDEKDVAQLIILGTPMNGTDCANLPASLNLYLPAILEIRPSYITGIFNPQITDRKGVPFYALAGTALDQPVQSPCTPVPSDIVVSADSVAGIEMHLTRLPVLHTIMTNSPEIYRDYVRPLLLRSDEEILQDDAGQAAASAPQLEQFTRVYTGHVPAGGSQELTIPIESGVSLASFAMFDTTRTLTTTVTGASGKTLQLSKEKNGLTVVDDPSSLLYLGYGFTDPKPGVWKVTVAASPKTPSEGADFAITARMTGGMVLIASVDPILPARNQSVKVIARLELSGQAVPIETAKLEILTPGGERQVRDFPLMPDGNLASSFTPVTAGLYSLDLLVSGTASDGTKVERTAFLSIETQPNVSSTQQYLIAGGIIGGILILLLLAAFLGLRSISRASRKRWQRNG